MIELMHLNIALNYFNAGLDLSVLSMLLTYYYVLAVVRHVGMGYITTSHGISQLYYYTGAHLLRLIKLYNNVPYIYQLHYAVTL